GAPGSSFSYDKSLLLQPGKCVSFVKMTTPSGLKNKNVQILSAALHIRNEKTLKLGAGKRFDVGIHKVKKKWTAKKLTYNNRPAYEAAASSTVGIQKKGNYQCDVTDIIRAWQTGEANYGVALAADNSNRSYRAELDRNPYFTIHYEKVGFEGAVELKENQPVTRDVLKAGQENYYYFDTEPGTAYDIYTESSADSQGILYDKDKKRTGYDDDSGLDRNFLFTGAYDGRRYLKVSLKDKATGTYTLYLKKRFAVPEPVGTAGQDSYTLTWDRIEKAAEYLVCVYDGGKKIEEVIVKGTSCEYIYTGATRGKTLGFTVTARKNASLTGAPSRMIYNRDSQSEWVYTTPMKEKRKNSSTATRDKKIYVLGGEDATGSVKSFAVYDTEKKTWERLPDYPGTATGICKAAMTVYHNEIIVIGGQTDTSASARTLKSVYAFNTETKKWQKKADRKEGRTDLAVAAGKDTLYTWTKAGKTNRTEIYHIKSDTWETAVLPDTSTVIDAASVDNRILVLKEDGEKMAWQEYLPEDNVYEDAGIPCPYAVSDRYRASAVTGGKIYMVKEKGTREVLVYDAYADEWGRISDMNLTKKSSALAACGSDLYSIGGEMTGFGVLDVVEQYTVKVQTTTREMLVEKGEAYELQVTAGNLKKGQTQVVTVNVNSDELEIQSASSFEEEEVLREGADGVTLLKYQPKKGVMMLRLEGSLERGASCEAYQSIPVEAKVDGKTRVEITLAEKTGKQ
ncbi:MAG: DNRLRE domain-containing protein, partial [Roseburia sp.]|nr:DNRLRE domain-containing protein [Roseburia sp.]